MKIEFYIDQIIAGLRTGLSLLEVREIACKMAADGYEKEVVLEKMAEARFSLSSDEEDRLFEVMDCVSGWCQAKYRVYPP
ncbi:MAG: hypothetical protein NTV80_04345 [Verrucomicrobia bacterium]|nr:hypothetical protein [Verrucomicrobiota bacterium]